MSFDYSNIKVGGTSVKELGNGIFAKLEYENPSGSVKDRAAYYMLTKAIERGEVGKDSVIIEPTSGNTGIGLAYIAQKLGLKSVFYMPESMSKERVALMTGYGAEVVLTPKGEGMRGSVERAKAALAETKNGYMPLQFDNLDNPLAHYETTAPEVFKRVPDLDFFVAGVGTGGTVIGVKRYIEEHNLKTKVVAVQPAKSPVLTGGAPSGHGIQGIGANFIPGIVDVKKLDKVISVADEDAVEAAKELNKQGVTGGISAGAAYFAAKHLKGKVLFIVPDLASRYGDLLV